MKVVWLLAALLTRTCCVCCQDNRPRYLGAVPVKLAGFSSWFVHEGATDPKERFTLLLSTFNPIPFTRDTTWGFRFIGKYLDDLGGIQKVALDENLVWPREPGQVPDDVFGFSAVSQPDGFLVPFKNKGTLRVIDVTDWLSPISYDIARGADDKPLWFYHRVVWKDMNGDGRQDAVTNRANVNTFTGKTKSEFLWFEQPQSDVFEEKWTAHIINKDIGDTFLIEQNIRAGNDTLSCLITVGYFSEKLAIHWSTHPAGRWDDPSQVKTRVIDTFGKYFDLQLVDVNLDGCNDLVVTVSSLTNGTLHVYEFPDDFRTGVFTMRILKSGFYGRSGLQGSGSPGSVTTFYPTKASEDSGVKPWMLLSGDDDGKCYVLKPRSQESIDWTYDLMAFVDEGPANIVGKPSVADVDSDGYADIFVPSYSKDKLGVYTYRP